MPERLAKGVRAEVRHLKSEDRRKEALQVRISAVLRKLNNPSWAECLSNSLKSKGFEGGISSLSTTQLAAVSEYYLINMKQHMESINPSEFSEQIKEFAEKYNDLFPKEDEENDNDKDPFVLSLKYLTEKFRLKSK